MRWLLIGLIALVIAGGGPGPRRAADPGRSPADEVKTASPIVSSTDESPNEGQDNGPDKLGRFAELALAVSGPSPLDDSPDNLDEEDLAILLEQPLRWHTDYETVLALSERSGKPIFVRFRCVP